MLEKNRNLKELSSGFCSKAYIRDDKYIQLIGKREDSFDSYKKLKDNSDLLVNTIKCVEYPHNMTLIQPNSEYPFGSLIYPMIKGNPLDVNSATNYQMQEIAKKIVEFNHEMHNSNIHWDRQMSINNKCKKIENSLKILQNYLTKDEITKLQECFLEFKSYLNNKPNFCITHGDLWAENLIVNEKNELIGIIDFENMSYFLPDADYASFWNMKEGFLDLLLKYSKEDVTLKSIALFAVQREVSGFPYIIPEGQEEIECQIQKIRDAFILYENSSKI